MLILSFSDFSDAYNEFNLPFQKSLYFCKSKSVDGRNMVAGFTKKQTD